MADPLEVACEKFAKELLKAGGFSELIPDDRIFTQSTDAPPDSDNKNRIVCAASPRQPFLTGKNQSVVLSERTPVEIRLYAASLLADQLATVISGIQSAMTARTGSDAAAAIAVAYKINLCFPTEEGDFSTEDNARKRSKTWNFISEV